MSQSKREQVVSHLRYLRQELREMHQGVLDDGLLPEAGEIRGVMAQMEALLELLEGKSPRKANVAPGYVEGLRNLCSSMTCEKQVHNSYSKISCEPCLANSDISFA